jgi:hypothetical protein
MDFSKLKLEVYDLLGLLLPGLVLICEGWILFRGWHAFVEAINQITGTSFTLLLLVSFPTGNAVQELGDLIVKRIKGGRFLKAGRDTFWLTPEAELVRTRSRANLGSLLPLPIWRSITALPKYEIVSGSATFS